MAPSSPTFTDQMDARDVGIAVMGTGSVGRRHIRVLSQIPHIVVLPISTRLHPEADVGSARLKTVQNLEAAKAEGASLAIIATDTGRHVEDSASALEMGLSVLVEKPLAVDAQQACRLTAHAAGTDRQVFVGCVLRFSEALNAFREFLHVLGALHAVRIECQSYLPDWRPARPYRDSYSARSEEGGVLRDLIHEIDYAGWMFGWPKALQATVKNVGRLHIASDELAELLWETPTGCVVSMRLDYLTRPPCRRMKVCGERGMMEWDGMAGTVTLAIDGTPIRVRRFTQTLDDIFMAQARAFIQTRSGVSDGRLATAEDGMRALAVCDAARCASQSRREELVHYP